MASCAGNPVDVENLEEVFEKTKALVAKLQSENADLKLKLEKVLGSFDADDVDVPCPSNVGLNDSYECGLSSECSQCWRDALDGRR